MCHGCLSHLIEFWYYILYIYILNSNWIFRPIMFIIYCTFNRTVLFRWSFVETLSELSKSMLFNRVNHFNYTLFQYEPVSVSHWNEFENVNIKLLYILEKKIHFYSTSGSYVLDLKSFSSRMRDLKTETVLLTSG